MDSKHLPNSHSPEILAQHLGLKLARSFALTLKLLPKHARPAVTITYGLARLSDTITDLGSLEKENRLKNLKILRQALASPAGSVEEFQGVSGLTGSEAELVFGAGTLLQAFRALPSVQRQPSERVLATLISTMEWDLETFDGSPSKVIWGCQRTADFDRYTYGIAGCVGDYWVRIFDLDVGLSAQAVNYGKALQRINILRDVKEDWDRGRVYFPIEDFDSQNRAPWEQKVWPDFTAQYFKETNSLLEDGLSFCNLLSSQKLKLASSLPLQIGDETLKLLRSGDFIRTRTKISRSQVYRLLLSTAARSLFNLPIRRRFFL